ncbi:MAG: epoxyqueuosine reductase [Thermoleophilia bacterium]|nr:epoxyqueuosine reductase [Thermoleophilia bacterium]
MTPPATLTSDRVIARARTLGASLAGIARADALLRSPLYSSLVDPLAAEGSAEGGGGDAAEPIAGLGSAPSVLVLALAHDPREPELDFWGVPAGTRGNQLLVDINRRLSAWLERDLAVHSFDLAYYVEKGGLYLKDAAVLAGLGSIGKNNLLVTANHGPRVRLRALAIDAVLDPTGPVALDPCDGCDAPCRRACPQGAFSRTVYATGEFGRLTLPGRDGTFSRDTCNAQMIEDQHRAGRGDTLPEADADPEADVPVPDGAERGETAPDGAGDLVAYCRRCELACVCP